MVRDGRRGFQVGEPTLSGGSKVYAVQGKIFVKKVLGGRIRNVVCLQTHTRIQSNYLDNGEQQKTYESFS